MVAAESAGPGLFPDPNVILMTGSPRLPVHNCALQVYVVSTKRNNRILFIKANRGFGYKLQTRIKGGKDD